MTDGTAALRAQLKQLKGTARTRPLVELAVSLTERYWRTGPGTPAAEPYLNEAILLLEEAYGYFAQDDYRRSQVANQLGWLRGSRHLAHGGSDDDREAGIRLLDEALAAPNLPPMLQLLAQLVLGQLLLSRVTGSMFSGEFATALRSRPSETTHAADVQRAVQCFRRIVDGPAISAEMTVAARTMLIAAEALQSLTGGLGRGLGGFDLSPMISALATLQRLEGPAGSHQSGAGLGFVPNLFEADALAMLDPMYRPVAVVEGSQPEAPTPPRASAPPESRVPAAELRKALLGRLPNPSYAAILALLDAAAPVLDIDAIDDLVALGSLLVEAPGAVGTDHLLLGVTLYLRSMIDGSGGWDSGADDVRTAGDSLLAAVDSLADERAEVVAVAVRLATLLDQRRPDLRVCARLADGFATVTRALRTVGAGGLGYTTAGQMLLLSPETGRFEYVSFESSLSSRILVVGDGPIPEEATVSYVRSGAQVIELATRTRLPLTGSVVFIANPRCDRTQATLDALVLRRTFYPRSIGLGNTAENIDGTGTPGEVSDRLNASMLHLGCGITPDGALELAGPALLDRVQIATGVQAQAGGIAVLPPTATGAAALTDAFLASRFVDVISFRHAVPDDVASLIYFLLHTHLVDEGREPARAVNAVQRWMTDPDRKPPEYLPAWCEAIATDPDLANPAYSAALIHHGV